MSFFYLFVFWACENASSELEEAPVAPVNNITENQPPPPTGSVLSLDGTEYAVDWDDGDTFSYVDPKTQKKVSARLSGFNTLESYGPVHQWGEWTAKELYSLAKSAGTFAGAQSWNCTDTQKGGGYGRILVDCPELRDAILRAGLAHPFSVGAPAPDSDIQALQAAVSAKAGMWEKGAPTHLITSLHSQDEKPDKDAYNRICVLETGQCEVETHTDTYTSCQNVCIHDSCMTYVPYKQRYGDERAACLR